MNRLLLAFIVSSMLPSCLIFPHYDRLTDKVAGCVVDAQNHPVSGAKVEFLFRGGRMLGSTITGPSGSFELGPFRQWFYITYIGSPGVYPFPYTLEYRQHGLPHVLRVRNGVNTANYMLGNQADFRKRSSPEYPEISIDLPRDGRWAGDTSFVKLMIAGNMQDDALPKQSGPNSPKTIISPIQP